MSILNYVVEKLKNGLITFVNAVSLANREYNFYDYLTTTTIATYKPYVVGTNNVNAKGDHHKRFVSKSTLAYCTTATDIIFNHAGNVAITLRADTWYEFKSNIYQVFHKYDALEGTLELIFEGVLPDEARTAE